MNRLRTTALRVQYASDLHRAGTQLHSILKPVAPVLALVGDIRPMSGHRDFLKYCSHNWNRVFVLGSECPMEEFPNVTILNRSRVEYEGVSFLGGEDRTWLSHEISSSADAGLPTVVITQDLPMVHYNELMRPPVRAWIAGRAHRGITYRNAANVMACANPYGVGYCGELFVEISTEVRDGDCGGCARPCSSSGGRRRVRRRT
jgi:hypothetical protein